VKKIYGIMIIDFMIVLIPLLLNSRAPELVEGISIAIVVLSLITILTLAVSDNESEVVKEVIADHKNRPSWWNIYDFTSDAVIIVAWASIDIYLVGILVILTKVSVAVKIPNYFSKES